MKKTLAPLSIAFALLLSGCSSSSTPPETSSSQPAPPPASVQPSETVEPEADLDPKTGDASVLRKDGGFFFVSSQNAIGKFTLPEKPKPDFEELRKIAKADPITYTLVQIDNREGSAYANMYALNVYDEAGSKYEFKTISETISEWREEAVTTDDTDLYNRFVDASNAQLDGVDPGMVGEIWMVTEGELPDTFSQITAEVHGAGDPIYAMSDKDGQGIDLTFEVPAKNKR